MKVAEAFATYLRGCGVAENSRIPRYYECNPVVLLRLLLLLLLLLFFTLSKTKILSRYGECTPLCSKSELKLIGQTLKHQTKPNLKHQTLKHQTKQQPAPNPQTPPFPHSPGEALGWPTSILPGLWGKGAIPLPGPGSWRATTWPSMVQGQGVPTPWPWACSLATPNHWPPPPPQSSKPHRC